MDLAQQTPQRLEAKIRAIAETVTRPAPLSPEEQQALIARIRQQLVEQDAVLIAHYYVDEQLQQLADETGGHVADSLSMADYGNRHPASTLVIAGYASWARRPKSSIRRNAC